jgi:hypothetical protein
MTTVILVVTWISIGVLCWGVYRATHEPAVRKPADALPYATTMVSPPMDMPYRSMPPSTMGDPDVPGMTREQASELLRRMGDLEDRIARQDSRAEVLMDKMNRCVELQNYQLMLMEKQK